MNQIKYPDYNNSVVSVSNSILKHFGAKTHHNSHAVLDELLSGGYKNVVYLVFDGLGSHVLESNLTTKSFLRRNKICDISAAFPSTTVASVTSIESGLLPIEHGWLGWSCYFKEVNACVNMFNNGLSNKADFVPADAEHLARKHLGYDDLLNQVDVKTYRVSPFVPDYSDYSDDFFVEIRRICELDEKKLVYVYHFQPDHDLHDYGCSNLQIQLLLLDIDRRLEKMCKDLDDTIVIITADHGHTDIKMLCLENYPGVLECLALPPSIEPRCVSFFVKDDRKKDFAGLFNKTFPGKFKLFSKQEFLDSGLLGTGKPHEKGLEFIGDYVAVAISDIALCVKNDRAEFNNFKASHAGLTEEEMVVPLIVFKKTKLL